MSGIRVNQAKNFKGEPYATEKFVRDMMQLPEGVDTLIDPDTGKLSEQLNPGITIQLKGQEVEQNATKINFIGNCMVVTNGEGFVTARIGDNLNSSNFNSQDVRQLISLPMREPVSAGRKVLIPLQSNRMKSFTSTTIPGQHSKSISL